MVKSQKPIQLTPVQQFAFDWLHAAAPMGNLFHLWSPVGRGRTTVLQELHRKTGGKLLGLKDFVEACSNTEGFIEYLRSQHLTSNVELNEVADVDFSELRGVDEVLKSLEANIVMPFENDELACELGIRPKRGVLLAGPPGTGKTTVARALAHGRHG